MPLIAEREAMADGWFKAGGNPEDYEIGLDTKVFHSGGQCGYIKHTASEPRTFATLMQIFKAEIFHGKRIRMSVFAKADSVGDWAGAWLRIDGPNGKTYQFDNMEDRPISGTSDWSKYEIVLDVPPDATIVAFGILLSGIGQIWVDDFDFQTVDISVPTTDRDRHQKPFPDKPINLSFE